MFYDNWVARDINGTALENAPFENVFHHPESSERFQDHLPIQVQSCWNGIAVLDPAPMYAAPHIRFRMARLAEGECSASECSLIGNDYWDAGYGRIIMVPRVKLAYDQVRLHRTHLELFFILSAILNFLISPSGNTRKCMILFIHQDETSPQSADIPVSVASPMTPALTRRIARGSDHMIVFLSTRKAMSSTSSLAPRMVSTRHNSLFIPFSM